MNQMYVLKEDLKLKYNNEEGENLLEDKHFMESDIKRVDKELKIPFEMDYSEANYLYNLNHISRLYFHYQDKMFSYEKLEEDEEYIDFNREQDLLRIEIIETVSFEVMLKMKKTMKININSNISFVVFLKNCTLLITVKEMYSKNNVKILKIVRNYFQGFPNKSDDESLEKEIFIASNEIYYVNDSKEYGGKNTDIPSNSNFYIYYDKGQFTASTNIKDSCYLCFRNTSTNFPIYVDDQILLCKFNENDFIVKIITLSDRNSIKIIKNNSFFLKDQQQYNDQNLDLRNTLPNNFQRPFQNNNSLKFNKQEIISDTNFNQHQYLTNFNQNNQIIYPEDGIMNDNNRTTVINDPKINNFGNNYNINSINSNQNIGNVGENININQVINQNIKNLNQTDINKNDNDKTEIKSYDNINKQQIESKNNFVLLKENEQDNLNIENSYNVDDYGSFKKLLEIQKQEKEKMRTYCRYCNYSKRADFFLHPECRTHKLENNVCIKCDHIICKDCSNNYRKCFFDNESVNKLERI
jgi:hypothetical protein